MQTAQQPSTINQHKTAPSSRPVVASWQGLTNNLAECFVKPSSGHARKKYKRLTATGVIINVCRDSGPPLLLDNSSMQWGLSLTPQLLLAHWFPVYVTKHLWLAVDKDLLQPFRFLRTYLNMGYGAKRCHALVETIYDLGYLASDCILLQNAQNVLMCYKIQNSEEESFLKMAPKFMYRVFF